MSVHVIVGAGSVGSASGPTVGGRGPPSAIDQSDRVADLTRRGWNASGSSASDRAALTRVTVGAVALYNCANPPYHRWPTDWPPLAGRVLGTAIDTGAGLLTVSNLYGYGPVDHPITESDPLAAKGYKGPHPGKNVGRRAAAQREGRAKVTEVRSSDYFGPGVIDTSAVGRLTPRVLAGRSVRVLGNPDASHSWTYGPGRGPGAGTLRKDARAWGRPWHVPTVPPMTQRQFLEAMAREAVRLCRR